VKVNLYLNISGQENLAKGDQLNYYNFDVRLSTDSAPEGYTWLTNPPAGAHLVAGNIELILPDKETATRAALAKIAAERQELQAELVASLAELAEREQKLMALSYTPAAVEPVDHQLDDIATEADLEGN
jgi:hypothetical protein